MSIVEAKNVSQRLPDGITLENVKDKISKIKKVCLLKTFWYPEIIDSLENSAKKYLVDLGISEEKIETKGVPGSLELPLAAQLIAKTNQYDFLVALGCVIKGETPHFDYVCSEVVSGLNQVSLDCEIPIGMGVLTVGTKEQAIARKDKGSEAAQAALLMSVFKEKLK